MVITLHRIGRKFNRDWIFRGVDMELNSGKSYVIQGPNGSGKSTLMKTIAGHILPSEGEVRYQLNGKGIVGEEVYRYLSIAAPYLDLAETFNLDELLDFHFRLKPMLVDREELMTTLFLEEARSKPITHYSSGMKQRLKLGLAIMSDTPMVFLDEPLSNLDQKGAEVYRHLVDQYKANRLFVVCSNQVEAEYAYCDVAIDLAAYKS